MPQVLRSRSYWADVYRAQNARRARANGTNPNLMDPHAPALSDGQVIVTFIPGNPIPLTSILHPNGALIPVPQPGAAATCAAQRPRRRQKAIARPAMHARPQPSNAKLIREDAELLARLQGPRGIKRPAGEVLAASVSKK
ncbi:hypothetical protein C8R43DRAFT_961522 [Mycena crocata]|nr:hypothetical protein C8R43DRAFT_961522 [Mycena crocata]